VCDQYEGPLPPPDRSGLSLLVGVVAAVVSTVVGTADGALAGALGGWTDRLLMRLVDVSASVPHLLPGIFIIFIVAMFRPCSAMTGSICWPRTNAYWDARPLAELIAEPLRSNGRPTDGVRELAETVGLGADLLGRRPHEVSDGQLQRACLARALVLRPRRLVCDEMTAMLDASTTAALVGVVEAYRRETGAGLPAVGHDRVLLERWCDRTVGRAELTSM